MNSRTLPLLTAACADQAEVLALSVTRFIAAGYMTADAACWDAAHSCAEEVLGAVAGPRLVAACAGVMRAIKAERSQPWTFMPASCCRITQHEADLVAALQLARQQDRPALHATCQRIAGADTAPRLATALEAAAATLDDIAPALAAEFPARPVRPLH
jgi:hypothetical protein